MSISDEDIKLVWDRIARTADGELIYAHLQKIAMGRMSGDPSDGALRADHGRRSLAHELMSLMGTGIDSAAGNRPLVFTVREPARTGGYTSPRARIAAGDPELESSRANRSGDAD